MSKTNKRKQTKQSRIHVPAPVMTLASLIGGRGRPFALAVLAGVVLLGGWHVLWRAVRDDVLSSDCYYMTAEDIEITPPPPWIHSDIQAEVFRGLSLDGPVSIMEDDTNRRIADAFSMHPWIARVHPIRKYHPARVTVEVEYRRPVCMVDVQGGLRPVDVHGVSLPCGDFSPIEASRYPRLIGIQTVPVGPVGTRWGDERVVGGAEIAGALGAAWRELGLKRIVPRENKGRGHGEPFVYELVARGGTRILWGHPPGAEMPSEAPAADKIARLKDYIKKHGTLDGTQGPQRLDVRGKQPPRGSGG